MWGVILVASLFLSIILILFLWRASDPSRERIRSVAGIVQSSVTVLAIIAAALWFLAQGEVLSRANISHKVTHRQITDKWTWVHVSIDIVNAGKRAFDIKSGIIRIQKILPLDSSISKTIARGKSPISQEDKRVIWPRIGKSYKPQLNVNISPGESDRLDFEFIIPSSVETVRIYSYFAEQESPPLGWATTTIYDLERSK